MEMFNDLRSDPEVREYFQFWFYMYPTGQPFWHSAAQMREDLLRARTVIDPHQQQPALDQMVLVGHSMGGLVSKLQAVESGDAFWGLVTDQPLERLHAKPQTRNTLAKTFFFEPSPSIRRVVTIGTPHRGSQFANDTTRWLGRKLISLPARMIQGRQALLTNNPGYFRASALLDIDTSIDSLDPKSPFLPVLYVAPLAPWVQCHNIVGKLPERGLIGQLAGDGDGVVSVASASVDNAHSEIIVPADHMSVHRHPRSILEIRRILLQHLDGLRSFAGHIRRLPSPAAPAAPDNGRQARRPST
jgi:pimeloyl-ACP methyl ester carboxylesterase